MKMLGVIANCQKAHAAEVLLRLAVKARTEGIHLVADEATAALLGNGSTPSLAEHVDKIDALMVLGGDGTLLRAVRELHGRDKLIIGVNLGGLGFLTSVAANDIERAVECFARNTFSFSERSLIEAKVIRKGQVIASTRALNDIVLRSVGARVTALTMSVGNEEVSCFVGDGLIIATPTGSTGHSLSAGGPIVLPQARVLLISLICPHTLSTRPLVIPDDAGITITVAKSIEDIVVAIDGYVLATIHPDDVVEIQRSSSGVRLIHLPGYSYFSVLRHKLHWRGSSIDVP